ncbi:TetR/AcrR family transcriptional regulator [Ktedonobacter sp. SOSP1-52]|uniref:TetR/AcrR family transcriptional regulator n=1 Tax=Ktedonobacter sp. SOSP1-52 TaxID=2778366 RepID=UPI0019155581|nr:TetR/AcrR family transcriptional regulator [Ktedonobacter sp. SOSP1-52]
MSRVGNSSDPRVQRTRQLLLKAFMALVQEKRNIHSISIQEIAMRATVNRATFYAHFEDKYALMADWSREKFQRALANELPPSSSLQKETLHLLILAVFDFMALSRRYYRPSNRQFELLYEMTIQQELYDLLLRWLQQVPSEIPLPEETIETTAQALSWAIFGPAAQWSGGDQSISKEVMAHHVLAIVVAGLSPVVTVT